jgi:hypothetical protein
MAEQTYTHLVLLLDKDMSINQEDNTESIYISKNKVVSPNDVVEGELNVSVLQKELGGEKLRLDVYLKDDLTVAKYKVSENDFNADNNYKSVEFTGIKMYNNITAQSQSSTSSPPPPPPLSSTSSTSSPPPPLSSTSSTSSPPPPLSSTSSTSSTPSQGGMKLNKKPKKKTKKGTYKRQSNKTK